MMKASRMPWWAQPSIMKSHWACWIPCLRFSLRPPWKSTCILLLRHLFLASLITLAPYGISKYDFLQCNQAHVLYHCLLCVQQLELVHGGPNSLVKVTCCFHCQVPSPGYFLPARLYLHKLSVVITLILLWQQFLWGCFILCSPSSSVIAMQMKQHWETVISHCNYHI